MKVARIILAAGMVLLCGFGWVSQLSGQSAASARYAEELEAARALNERGLYQRSLQSYAAALAIQEDSGARQEMLSVYAKAYSDGLVKSNAYRSALEDSCAQEPKNADYWTGLLELLRSTGNYREARKTVDRAARAGAKSETLSALSTEICYSYTTSGQFFTQYCSAPNGYTSICIEDRWGAVAPDGDREYDCSYPYIGPYSVEGTALFRTDSGSQLLDSGHIIQAIPEENFTEVRAYSEGLLPVCQDGQWRYLDCERDAYLPGSYSSASAYRDGLAAVCQDAGWTLVDTAGNPAGEQVFSDVKLYGNGDYCWNGFFVASTGNGWGLYQADGTAANEFLARDMDLYLGSLLAFQDDAGLWGYVDRKGKTVIEPRYMQAKSFSGGLAAVFDGEAWGFIDRTGALVIPCQFKDTGYFTSQGACPVSTVEGGYSMIILRFPEGR